MSGIGIRAFACVAAALLGAGAAMAEPRDISGVYDMTARAKGADGKSVCVERWTLDRDGGFLVESGQERVRGHWRLMGGEKDGWKILWTDQVTNGLADCTGKRATQPLSDVMLNFYFNVDNDIVLTRAPGRNADGSLIYEIGDLLQKVRVKP